MKTFSKKLLEMLFELGGANESSRSFLELMYKHPSSLETTSISTIQQPVRLVQLLLGEDEQVDQLEIEGLPSASSST